MANSYGRIPSIIALALVLIGCQAAPATSPASPNTFTPEPATATPAPSATATSMPTVTVAPPTATPQPTTTTAPSATPTPEPSPTPTQTPEPPAAAAQDGWVRYTSQALSVSFALPPEWACINHDPDSREKTLAALKARMKNDSFGLFDMVISQLFSRAREDLGLHCFYDPDMNTFMGDTFTMAHLGATGQFGFTSVLKLAYYGPECGDPYLFSVQGRDAASALCTYPESSPPIVFRVDVLDGPRHVALTIRTHDDTLVSQFEAIRDTLRVE